MNELQKLGIRKDKPLLAAIKSVAAAAAHSNRNMAPSPLLTTPTTSIPLAPPNAKPSIIVPVDRQTTRRGLAISVSSAVLTLSAAMFVGPAAPPARAEADEEYVRETKDVIVKVRQAISLNKSDPNVVDAVAELRNASNSWVAKYRREKSLLGRPSFREMYSALNAVSGHYISFGLTAPIPAKRKTRILEEVDTAEKALLRGR